MGTSQPAKPVTEGEQAVTINHPRFASLRVVSAPTEDDEGIIEIGVALPSEAEFKRWDKRVSAVPQSQNLFLPLQRRFEKTEFCGSGGIATITYKYYPYLLSDQVINRCNMEGKFFEQAQLWYLVYSIISAGEAFHSTNSKIGDVRPQNVFISPEGQVRVATHLTWPNEQSNYQKTAFDKEITYLSPQELRDIGYGKHDEPTEYGLNEAFSIGLTCLDAATLTDSTALYQSNNRFNANKLEQRLNSLEKNGRYSPPLVLLIKALCQVEENKRVTCHQLAQWLNKYQPFITELQEFTVTELPQKLNRLAPEKPRPQPQTYQYQTQIPPQSYPVGYNVPPPANYTTAPTNVRPLPGQYQQFLYQPQFSTYVPSGSGVANRSVSQGSNNNPSIITFQKDPRSSLEPAGSQLRGAPLNLQQIDQQLQMSRKLFPS